MPFEPCSLYPSLWTTHMYLPVYCRKPVMTSHLVYFRTHKFSSPNVCMFCNVYITHSIRMNTAICEYWSIFFWEGEWFFYDENKLHVAHVVSDSWHNVEVCDPYLLYNSYYDLVSPDHLWIKLGTRFQSSIKVEVEMIFIEENISHFQARWKQCFQEVADRSRDFHHWKMNKSRAHIPPEFLPVHKYTSLLATCCQNPPLFWY